MLNAVQATRDFNNRELEIVSDSSQIYIWCKMKAEIKME